MKENSCCRYHIACGSATPIICTISQHMRICIKLITGIGASCPRSPTLIGPIHPHLSSPLVTTIALHFACCSLSLSPSPTMIIYKCRFTGDEMCSDAFKPVPVKDDDGSEVPGLFQIASQKVNKVRGRGRGRMLS